MKKTNYDQLVNIESLFEFPIHLFFFVNIFEPGISLIFKKNEWRNKLTATA
jgi:hypothetical protein